ncbi:hypothetical protein J2S40_004348 [Nocardioides luteus]|uniref:DUF3800 domain-containing protein n=1 Tax=Nocardioides luteus TaxID=1844 RepID=A0ABQ5SQC7_9ACTN|nr:DUF3800 domain-containing protein [Nocardioides luteus]MDR7313290.1 hypothetical protein [Nocardioides luteus]GGR42761.1 hypothetical protein GCM10010197_05070 [Nocardioides luteus]GLJ66355.1 hypothetical protein GCM10017579_03910 [Nocardioides luteus]
MAEVWAYIDETGDRGMSAASSPIFGMAAVIVDRRGAAELQAAVERLRGDFKVPAGKVMSWKEHVKTHDRRRHAARVLATVQGMKVCYVYAIKTALTRATYTQDRALFYNYVAMKTYTSVLWAARSWKGERTRLWTRFGHVRHHDHKPTEAYLRREASRSAKIPDHLEQGLRWVPANKYAESQAADLFGGFLKAALWPSGEFSLTEPAYLLSVWSKIRNSEDCAVPLGIMSMPDSSLVTRESWFPCTTCTKT